MFGNFLATGDRGTSTWLDLSRYIVCVYNGVGGQQVLREYERGRELDNVEARIKTMQNETLNSEDAQILMDLIQRGKQLQEEGYAAMQSQSKLYELKRKLADLLRTGPEDEIPATIKEFTKVLGYNHQLAQVGLQYAIDAATPGYVPLYMRGEAGADMMRAVNSLAEVTPGGIAALEAGEGFTSLMDQVLDHRQSRVQSFGKLQDDLAEKVNQAKEDK